MSKTTPDTLATPPPLLPRLSPFEAAVVHDAWRAAVHGEFGCPACGHDGPHKSNGEGPRSPALVWACAGCGESFAASSVFEVYLEIAELGVDLDVAWASTEAWS